MRKLLWLCLTLSLFLLFSAALADELVMGVSQLNVFADAGERGVKYASNDPSIAGVDAVTGRLSAYKPGTCTITAEKDGVTVYSLSLTVKSAPTKLSVPEKSVEMMLGSYALPQPCSALEGEYDESFEVRVRGEAVSVVDGKLYARDIGTATVYIRAYNDAYASYEVKVRIKPSEVTLNASELHLNIGDEYTLSASFGPAFSFTKLTWTIDSDGSITFDEDRLRLKAVSYGSGTVTVTTENGLSDSVYVSVLPLPETLLTPETINTVEKSSGKIGHILPEGTYAPLEYESLTPQTVRVTSGGVWTAAGYGEGSVKVSASGTGLSVIQHFKISPLPKNIVLSCPVSQMYVGQRAECSVKLLPEGSAAEIVWRSTNPTCVGVDESGVLTAYAYGTAIISASCAGDLKSSVTVSVLRSPESISLDPACIELEVGKSVKLNGVFPANTLSRLSFVSLNPEIASVDEDGTVKALSSGCTAILATTATGVSANCFVCVTPDEPVGSSELEVIFMDVDSNDSIILRSGDEYAIIDTGNHIYGEKAAAFLNDMGITHLKYYIGTHAHLDHVGGACVILDNFDVDMVLVPHVGVTRAILGSVWTESERTAANQAVYCVLPHGFSFYLGSARFKCIGPINIKRVDSTDDEENSNSMVLRAEVGDVSLLLTGDGTISEFNAIMRVYSDEIKCDVFKNTHHSGELSAAQINAISPRITVFSTSSLHIPEDRYLKLFTDLGSEIYMTPTRINGNIDLYTDGETITVTPQFEDNRANWYNEITGKPKN